MKRIQNIRKSHFVMEFLADNIQKRTVYALFKNGTIGKKKTDCG